MSVLKYFEYLILNTPWLSVCCDAVQKPVSYSCACEILTKIVFMSVS